MKLFQTILLAWSVVFLTKPCMALDPNVEQLIVSIAPTWSSMTGKLQCFEKVNGKWIPASAVIPVLYGKNGLAWGIGEHPHQEGLAKEEKDRRSPAGIFTIGTIYTYDSALPKGANFPFHTIGKGDAWIDDVTHPKYNQHVVIDPANPPPWFEKQKMRHGDFAYRWLVEIRHNSNPPQSGKGSAIFFHIRRGESTPTFGCTTMAEKDLVKLIQWLRANKKPTYVLLPAEEYRKLFKPWGLPEPKSIPSVLAF